MCGSKKKAPPPPAVLPEAPTLPDGTPSSVEDVDKRRRRASAGKSLNSTILTSTRGVSGDANTPAKTLLGA